MTIYTVKMTPSASPPFTTHRALLRQWAQDSILRLAVGAKRARGKSAPVAADAFGGSVETAPNSSTAVDCGG